MSGRGAQARMMEKTGWSKATMSQLFKGTQDYSPKILIEAATALNAEPWELLMPPEKAMRLRRIQEGMLELAHEAEVVKFELRDDDRREDARRGTGTKG